MSGGGNAEMNKTESTCMEARIDGEKLTSPIMSAFGNPIWGRRGFGSAGYQAIMSCLPNFAAMQSVLSL